MFNQRVSVQKRAGFVAQVGPDFKCAFSRAAVRAAARPASEPTRSDAGSRARVNMGFIGDAAAAVGGFICRVLNYFTDLFLTPPVKASLTHLEETELKPLTGGNSPLHAV